MKKIILIAFIACIVLAACNKDKFKTQPQISIDSYSTKVVGVNDNILIDLKFTDKEGDLSGGKFVYMQKRTNRRPPPPGTSYNDSIITTIPTFPNNTSGTLQLNLAWRDLHLSDAENDTLYFRFVAVDLAGNKSDTVNSDKIVVLRQ